MDKTTEKIIAKILSGRWILTVIGGIAFLWCVFHKYLEAATITAILLAIFKDYFSRDRTKEKDVKSNPPDTDKSV